MKIAVVQFKAIKGNIEKNIEKHKYWIETAIQKNANLIMFPELSITGYEPNLAKELAIHQNDKRLDVFQEISDRNNVTICVGVPTRDKSDVFISMVIFQVQTERVTYSKRFLHVSEESVFTFGTIPVIFKVDHEVIAPAICYELSIPEHHQYAKDNCASIYMASVLNAVHMVDNDLRKLSAIAKSNRFLTFMSNYVGESGGYDCAGKSSVWNREGELVGQLDEENEGFLIYDTVKECIIT